MVYKLCPEDSGLCFLCWGGQGEGRKEGTERNYTLCWLTFPANRQFSYLWYPDTNFPDLFAKMARKILHPPLKGCQQFSKPPKAKNREYWMINRRSGFLALVWFGSSPNPLPPISCQQVVSFLSLPVCRRERGRGWGGAQGADPSPLPLHVATAGENNLHEEITPLLPLG